MTTVRLEQSTNSLSKPINIRVYPRFSRSACTASGIPSTSLSPLAQKDIFLKHTSFPPATPARDDYRACTLSTILKHATRKTRPSALSSSKDPLVTSEEPLSPHWASETRQGGNVPPHTVNLYCCGAQGQPRAAPFGHGQRQAAGSSQARLLISCVCVIEQAVHMPQPTLGISSVHNLSVTHTHTHLSLTNGFTYTRHIPSAKGIIGACPYSHISSLFLKFYLFEMQS